MRSKIFRRNSSLQAVCDTPMARVTASVCPHYGYIGRRLPLELQCSLCQGQQGDVSQSVRGKLQKPVSEGGQNLTAVEKERHQFVKYILGKSYNR